MAQMLYWALRVYNDTADIGRGKLLIYLCQYNAFRLFKRLCGVLQTNGHVGTLPGASMGDIGSAFQLVPVDFKPPLSAFVIYYWEHLGFFGAFQAFFQLRYGTTVYHRSCVQFLISDAKTNTSLQLQGGDDWQRPICCDRLSETIY